MPRIGSSFPKEPRCPAYWLIRGNAKPAQAVTPESSQANLPRFAGTHTTVRPCSPYTILPHRAHTRSAGFSHTSASLPRDSAQYLPSHSKGPFHCTALCPPHRVARLARSQIPFAAHYSQLSNSANPTCNQRHIRRPKSCVVKAIAGECPAHEPQTFCPSLRCVYVSVTPIFHLDDNSKAPAVSRFADTYSWPCCKNESNRSANACP